MGGHHIVVVGTFQRPSEGTTLGVVGVDLYYPIFPPIASTRSGDKLFAPPADNGTTHLQKLSVSSTINGGIRDILKQSITNVVRVVL